MLTEQDELGIYHVLRRLRGRIRHIKLSLPPPILHNVLVLMDENFPILEHLALSRLFSVDCPPLTLPKGFLAPNLLHLDLFEIGLSKRLRVFTSTVSLVTLALRRIQSYSDFRPRLLVARLRSLPLLEELTISFPTLISHLSTERELLGETGAPITLPSLKILTFRGVGAYYLESLVAQIRVPLLERLYILPLNQIAFALPHLCYLINITEAFKLPTAMVHFNCNMVGLSFHHDGFHLGAPFLLSVMCGPVDRQIDFAAQICHALIPTLSGVRTLLLSYREISTEMRNGPNGVVNATTWHDLLRTFIGVKKLHIYHGLMEEVSHALQVDEVASDPSFLPKLRSICAKRNLFTSFIYTRQVMYRPVQFKVVSE